jgi:hypothetical protein
MNPDEFFATSYGDRQLITFVEDSDLDKPRKSLEFKKSKDASKVAPLLVSTGLVSAGLVSTGYFSIGVAGIVLTGGLAIPLVAGGVAYGIGHFFRSKEANPPLVISF